MRSLLIVVVITAALTAYTIHSPNRNFALTFTLSPVGWGYPACWPLSPAITSPPCAGPKANANGALAASPTKTPGQRYAATICADGKGAGWQKTPAAYQTAKQVVTSKAALTPTRAGWRRGSQL